MGPSETCFHSADPQTPGAATGLFFFVLFWVFFGWQVVVVLVFFLLLLFVGGGFGSVFLYPCGCSCRRHRRASCTALPRRQQSVSLLSLMFFPVGVLSVTAYSQWTFCTTFPVLLLLATGNSLPDHRSEQVCRPSYAEPCCHHVGPSPCHTRKQGHLWVLARPFVRCLSSFCVCQSSCSCHRDTHHRGQFLLLILSMRSLQHEQALNTLLQAQQYSCSAAGCNTDTDLSPTE